MTGAQAEEHNEEDVRLTRASVAGPLFQPLDSQISCYFTQASDGLSSILAVMTKGRPEFNE